MSVCLSIRPSVYACHSVCLSVRMEQVAHAEEFSWNWHLRIAWKSVEKIKVQSDDDDGDDDDNNNNGHVTQTPVHTAGNSSLTSSYNEKCFRQKQQTQPFCVQCPVLSCITKCSTIRYRQTDRQPTDRNIINTAHALCIPDN